LESLKIINSASAEADKLYTEEMSRAEESLKRNTTSAEKDIIKAKDKALEDIRADITSYVEEIVKKVADIKVDKSKISKVVTKNS